MEEKLLIDEEYEQYCGIRLDKALSEIFPDCSRTLIQQLCEKGEIKVNDKPVPKSCKLKLLDRVEFTIPAPVEYTVEAENIPLDIVYEDDDLLVVNKPKGMVVHPAPGNYTGTLVNALMYHCKDSLSGINGVMRPGIVHRIDKNTTGLLLVAKSDAAHRGLAEQIKAHSLHREYMAIVHGHFKQEQFKVDAPIGRNPADRKKMCVTDKNSRNAVTHVTVLENLKGYSLVKCVLETGRTHQIRVHLAYMGHPVAGDDVYCTLKTLTGTEGQCLHAGKLGFIHPITGEYMEFYRDPPKYFTDYVAKLRDE